MRKRRIGSLEVTVAGMGCSGFGDSLDAERTRRVMHAALGQGINFFDTADYYGNPRTSSESLIGEVIESLGSRRDELVIATKFGRVLDDRKGSANAKAAYVKSATEASLRRLRTDWIDLMQIHIPDPGTPIDETLGALSDLIAEGKIREIGASQFSVVQLREAAGAANSKSTPGFVSTQAEYSVLNREAETDVLAECARNGMVFLPFFPLYGGLLTGKYRAGGPLPAGSRMAGKTDKLRTALFSGRNMAIVAALTDYAELRGHTLLELGYAWLLSHPVIPSVIAGATTPEQVAANVAATNWKLTAAERADIDRIAPLTPGHGLRTLMLAN